MYEDYGDGDEYRHASFVETERPDRGIRIRLWIAGVLAALIVLLFVAERFVTLVQPNLDRMQARRDLASVDRLEEDVERVLDSYGILPDWIRRREVHLDDAGHVRDVWIVSVPRDVPMASLNLDLKTLVEEYSGRSFAIENAKEAQIAVHIKFRGSIRYSLVFTPTSEISRQGGSIALLVDGLTDASQSDIDAFIQTQEPIACIIEPHKDNVSLHTQLRAAGKAVVLHLHFKPLADEESRYELAESMTEADILKHVRSIARNFPGSSAYYLTSERAPGMAMRLVDKELASKGLRKLESAMITYIDRGSGESVMSTRMNDLAALSAREGVSVGVVELRENVVGFLQTEISRLRKKGFNFIPLDQRVLK